MRLIKATEADNDRLKVFFERMMLPGSIDFTIRRYGSFFDQYRLQSDDFKTYLLLDETETLVGMASLVFQEGFVLGEKETWGYATDLRIAPTRAAILQWAQHFMPVLEEECAKRRCKNVFSAVHLYDNQAYNALIRPTSHARRKMPRYHLANKFRLVFLHGKLPFTPKPLTSIQLKALEENDIEPLCAYLADRARRRPLSGLYQPDEWIRRMRNWQGFEPSEFRIARDKRGNIIGCAGLWDGRTVQSFIPQTYHGFAHTRHQSLKLASWLGLVRPTPEPETPLPTRYLTHLNADSGEVFFRLVDDAFSRLGPKELLAYCHFRGNWRTLPPLPYVASSLSYGLYRILPPNVEPRAWPSPNMDNLPPEFEAAWL